MMLATRKRQTRLNHPITLKLMTPKPPTWQKKSRRSVYIDEKALVLHSEEEESQRLKDTSQTTSTWSSSDPALHVMSDDETLLIPKDVPSADMFQSEGLSAEAAYLL
mmetsp:Transcript_39349/g.64939  ORF Transcript_39349/g.64939 Transcript_39349/m.64939 type:complete len:107 (+) Transcript_39349:157-477(+)